MARQRILSASEGENCKSEGYAGVIRVYTSYAKLLLEIQTIRKAPIQKH